MKLSTLSNPFHPTSTTPKAQKLNCTLGSDSGSTMVIMKDDSKSPDLGTPDRNEAKDENSKLTTQNCKIFWENKYCLVLMFLMHINLCIAIFYIGY